MVGSHTQDTVADALPQIVMTCAWALLSQASTASIWLAFVSAKGALVVVAPWTVHVTLHS